MSNTTDKNVLLPPGIYDAKVRDVIAQGDGRVRVEMAVERFNGIPQGSGGQGVAAAPTPTKPVVEEKRVVLDALMKEFGMVHEATNKLQQQLYGTDPAVAPHFHMIQDLANHWRHYTGLAQQIRELTSV